MAESQFRIERGLPIPGDRRPGIEKYPFRSMQIGDSIFVPFDSFVARDGTNDPGKLRWSLVACAKGAGIKVAIRSERNGYRVWRIEAA